MKLKTLLIILILGSTDICFGQTDTITHKKFIFGVSMGTMNSIEPESFDYYSHFTIEKGGSFFAIGPVIGNKLKIQRYYLNSVSSVYQLSGLHAVYQLNPNTKGKRFNFYFQNEFIFLYHTDKGVNYVYIPNSYNSFPVPRSYKSHETGIADFIGYGFKVQFLKNFYLNQSIGIGVVYNYSKADYGDISLNYTEHGFQPGLILKLGLGYIFNKKLKPVSDIDKIFFQK